MAERQDEEPCIYCGTPSERDFPPDAAPYVINDIKPYHDKGLGVDIGSRSERRAIMTERGLVEVGNDNMAKEAEEIVKEQYARNNKRPPKINK